MTDMPACPVCGSPINTLDHQYGYHVTAVGGGPFGGDTHYLGPLDEAPATTFETREVRDPRGDRVTLEPCGHVFEGAEAGEVVALVNRWRAREAERAADAVLDGDAAVIEAAERAGRGELVELYRQAVRGRSKDAPGLLAALKALAGPR